MEEIQKQKDLFEILKRTAGITGVPSYKIQGLSRERHVVDARQVFCCVAYYDGYTYEEIGQCLDRHYSSIIHICNERPMTAEGLMHMEQVQSDSAIMSKIQKLAYRVYQNPEDEDAKQQLKLLI